MIDHDPTRTYRAAVIGAGSGGLTLAIGLAGFGHEVALIESGPIGGDCTNVGCIPSKSLLHAARAGTSDPFGTVRAKRDDLSGREDAELVEHDLIHLVRGRARLAESADPHVVTVVGVDGTITSVRAENVVICAGSKPVQFPIDGLDAGRILTNESLFELDTAPTKIVMIGGGAISLEMATAFRDLASHVEIVELQDRLLPTEDPLVSTTIKHALEDQGVIVHTGTSIERVDSATAHLANGTTISDVDKVLFAVGRRPQLDDLGLDVAGVESTADGIVADSFGRTNVDGIFAVGDVTGNTLTTHGANSIARRTIRAIALPYLPKLGEPRAQPSAVFSRPQVASVGLSVDAVDALPRAGRRRYVVQIADLDRGLTDDVEHGVAIVDAERFTGKILRAAIVGPAAAEVIGIFTMAIDHGIGLRKIFSTVHPYPAYAQLVGQVADDFARDTFSSLPIEWWGMVRGRIGRRLRRHPM
ncbi:dihydrolipoyl dehydrogenase family protein [Ilumatobacter nonamiensis]|uniref:dihydrolipoyl dehydrogenase family protein n=1 Tax=Ilumatobacter nonamiensis TaxID=467093 RepID=UPI00034B2DF9|nr:NAD(P)/FAD-dependent oxidoreductase [Ilumatobacter nonamiensis]